MDNNIVNTVRECLVNKEDKGKTYCAEEIARYISLLLSKQETDIVQRESKRTSIVVGVMGFIIVILSMMSA